MLYTEFIHKAEELTIQQGENGLWYLEPEWHDILWRNGLGEIDDLTDSYLTGMYDVEDVLKLEVEKRNATQSVKPYIELWIHDLITAAIEPAMLQEENEFIKNMTEYMKVNHQKNDSIVSPK